MADNGARDQCGVFPPLLLNSRPPTRRPEIKTTVPAVSLPLPQHSAVSFSQRPATALVPTNVQISVFIVFEYGRGPAR